MTHLCQVELSALISFVLSTNRIYEKQKTLHHDKSNILVIHAFSAIGELTLNETVVHSMAIIQMPVYLLYLLGVLKISGIMALWFSPYKWIKEWAYAGFTFDFIAAIFWLYCNRMSCNARYRNGSGGFDAVLIYLFFMEENELNFFKR